MLEVAEAAAAETPAVPVTSETQARARGKDGKFVPGPGDPKGFDKAFDEAWERQAAGEQYGKERRDDLMSLAAPAKKEEEQPEEGSKAKADEPPAGKAKSAKAESAAVTAAKTALRRLQVPAKVVDGLTEAELAEWQGAIGTAAKHDSTYAELGELRKGKTESAAPVKESATADQPFDLDKALQPLEPTLDEDAVKAVGQILRQMQAHSDAQIASLKKQLEGVVPEIEQSKAARVRTVVDQAKAGLVKRFPQLEDPDVFKAVLEQMADLNVSRKYSDPGDLMLRACKAQLLEEASESEPPPQPRPKRAASPITDTSKPSQGPMTFDKAFDQAYGLLDKGLSVGEVKARLGR